MAPNAQAHRPRDPDDFEEESFGLLSEVLDNLSLTLLQDICSHVESDRGFGQHLICMSKAKQPRWIAGGQRRQDYIDVLRACSRAHKYLRELKVCISDRGCWARSPGNILFPFRLNHPETTPDLQSLYHVPTIADAPSKVVLSYVMGERKRRRSGSPVRDVVQEARIKRMSKSQVRDQSKVVEQDMSSAQPNQPGADRSKPSSSRRKTCGFCQISDHSCIHCNPFLRK